MMNIDLFLNDAKFPFLHNFSYDLAGIVGNGHWVSHHSGEERHGLSCTRHVYGDLKVSVTSIYSVTKEKEDNIKLTLAIFHEVNTSYIMCCLWSLECSAAR